MFQLIGRQVKDFRIIEEIGSGGFGVVYRARQQTVARDVAIKVVLPKFATLPEFVRRFELEAQLIARLEHPHITPLYDYWRDPEGTFLVMRFLRGGSLKAALRQGPLSPESASRVLDQVTAALDVAHRCQIIHRDIKPANILLDEDGNAYLTDFGIAKDLEAEVAEGTRTGVILGSPDYLSPEQARSEPVTPQTDIYSLGITLYEMLTGQHPFPDVPPVERLFLHIHEPVPEIDCLDPEVQEKVNKVIQKAVQKDPTRRFKNALELGQAFRWAVGFPIEGKDPGISSLLTARELSVLEHMVAGHSNREIAEALVLELESVQWYSQQIFQKLSVRSRMQAVVRAKELNLVDGPGESMVSDTVSLAAAPENPYKGLRAFGIADEQDFFGREEMVQKLIHRLLETGPQARFLGVVGPSGSGKSSLVKAGLIPALWRGDLPGSDKWYIVEMTPGPHPFDELEVALTRIAAEPVLGIQSQLLRDERGLLRVSKLILPDDDSQLLLVLDQFEEVFTLVEKEALREHFLKLICQAVLDPHSRVRVVATLRADFYDRPLHYPEFGALLRDRVETILPLSVEELERAILMPARRVGVGFESGLAAQIVQEIHHQPGALPLMQYALTELFEYREERLLTHAGYSKIGGAVGALAMRAEEAYQALDGHGRETLRQAFLRLVTLGEGTEHARRRVLRTELLGIAPESQIMSEILDAFVAYRLLSLDRDPQSRETTVEVAHEALLREWERLRKWLFDSLEDIRQQRQLAAGAIEWVAAGYDPGFLLRGARLTQFDTWSQRTSLALTPVEKSFLEGSIAAREERQTAESARQAREKALEVRSRRFLQALVGVLALATLAAVILSSVAFRQRNLAENNAATAASAQEQALRLADSRATQQALAERESDARATAQVNAQEAEYEARFQAAIGLAGQALRELDGKGEERAAPLVLEALEKYPYTWQGQRALSMVAFMQKLRLILAQETNNINLQLSRDGRKLLAGSEGGAVRVWDALSGEEMLRLDTGGPSFTSWSPAEDRILVYQVDDSSLQVYDADGGIQYSRSITSTISALRARFWLPWSPDGTRFVTGHTDGTARIWDARTGEELLRLQVHPEEVLEAIWSPVDERILTFNNETATLWDAVTGEVVMQIPGEGWFIYFGSWTADGTRFVARAFGWLGVFDGITGELIKRIETGMWNQSAYLSPDGTQLIAAGYDGNARLWNVDSGQLLFMLPGLKLGNVASWSPDGKFAAVGENENDIFIWNTQTGEVAHTLHYKEIPTSLVWHPSGLRLYAGSSYNTEIYVYDLNPDLVTIAGQPGIMGTPSWSPDGVYVANGFPDGVVRIWKADDGTLVRSFDHTPMNLIYHTAWSPGGDWLLTIGACEMGDCLPEAIIWDVKSGDRLLSFNNHDGKEMWTCAWSPDGTRVMTLDFMRTAVAIMDAASGELLQKIEPPGGVNWTAWSPDGLQILTTGPSGRAIIWDVRAEEMVLDLFPEEYGDFLYAGAWSPDGTQVAIWASNYLHLFDTRTGEALQKIATTNGTWDLDWSRAGDKIFLFGWDGVSVFDVEMGVEIFAYDYGPWLTGKVSPDETKMVVTAVDGYLHILPLITDLDELVAFTRDCCLIRELTDSERTAVGLPPIEK
jgi:serine/threonine protein kinase/WD40 repeat protein